MKNKVLKATSRKSGEIHAVVFFDGFANNVNEVINWLKSTFKAVGFNYKLPVGEGILIYSINNKFAQSIEWDEVIVVNENKLSLTSWDEKSFNEQFEIIDESMVKQFQKKYTIAPHSTENPMESITTCITGNPKDFSKNVRDAWLYGIVVGWSDETYDELKDKFADWNDEVVARNKRLHEKFEEAWIIFQK